MALLSNITYPWTGGGLFGGGDFDIMTPQERATLAGWMQSGMSQFPSGAPSRDIYGTNASGVGLDPSKFQSPEPFAQPNGDPNAGLYGPLTGQQQMPQTSFVFSTEGKQAPQQAADSGGGAFDFRPGSPFDQLKKWYQGQGQATAAPARPGFPPMSGMDVGMPATGQMPAGSPQMPAGSPPAAPPQPPSWVADMQRGGMPSPQTVGAPLSLAPPNPTVAGVPPTDVSSRARTPSAPAAMPPQEETGFGDRLNAGFGSFAGAPTIGGALLGGLAGLMTGKRNDAYGTAQQNQQLTTQAIFNGLKANNMDPQQAMAIAMAAAANPEIAKAILPQALGPKEPPKTIEEAIARQVDAQIKRGGNTNGIPANYLQIYNDYVTQKSAAEARGKQLGEAQGKAAGNMPISQQRGQDVIGQIDELLQHPGFDRVFGLVGAFPNLPGGAAAGAQARLNQVKGQAFLDAYDMLKGGGAITEVEGAKATAAKARLEAAQSPTEARQALQDFKAAVRTGMQKLKETSGQAPVTSPVDNSGWSPVPGMPDYRIRKRQQ